MSSLPCRLITTQVKLGRAGKKSVEGSVAMLGAGLPLPTTFFLENWGVCFRNTVSESSPVTRIGLLGVGFLLAEDSACSPFSWKGDSQTQKNGARRGEGTPPPPPSSLLSLPRFSWATAPYKYKVSARAPNREKR